MNDRQKTISKEVTFAGPGLFSGEPATLTFVPADAGAGITFVREQDGKVAHIPAPSQNVLKRPRRTCLKNGTLFVETDRALHGGPGRHGDRQRRGEGLAAARVGEVPGRRRQQPAASSRRSRKPASPSRTRRSSRWSSASRSRSSRATPRSPPCPGPTDRLEIIYDFEAPAPVGRQIFALHLGDRRPRRFVTQVAPARTFVFEQEASELRAAGLGQHLTPQGSAGDRPRRADRQRVPVRRRVRPAQGAGSDRRPLPRRPADARAGSSRTRAGTR